MEDLAQDTFQKRILEFVHGNFLIIALFSVGLIFLGIGMIQFFGAKKVAIEYEKGNTLSSQDSGSLGPSGKIKVDVEGAVLKPGLYALASDARVQDALIAAGGLAPDANRKTINLAQKLSDGAKIYIPAQGEAMPAKGENNSAFGGSVLSSETSSTGLVSINSASGTELESLPAIGPVTAGKIIDGRPYGSVQELLSRKIVGKATFEKIRDLISL